MVASDDADRFPGVRVELDCDPGSGGSRTYTVYVNGRESAVTVTVSDRDTTTSLHLGPTPSVRRKRGKGGRRG